MNQCEGGSSIPKLEAPHGFELRPFSCFKPNAWANHKSHDYMGIKEL